MLDGSPKRVPDGLIGRIRRIGQIGQIGVRGRIGQDGRIGRIGRNGRIRQVGRMGFYWTESNKLDGLNGMDRQN